MYCNCSDIAMQSSERSEPKYDRDFLLSPAKRNELLELWEVEKFGRDCFVIGSSSMSCIADSIERSMRARSEQSNCCPAAAGPRVCSLRHLDHFRALDRVTRMAEIADADQPVTIPLQQDKIGRPRLRLVRVANQDRRPAVNLAGNQTPVVD